MGSGQEPGEAEWVQTLAEHAERRQYRGGETVCRQGDPANRLYVIIDGRATAVLTTVDGFELTLETLQPGALFGESAAGSSGACHAASVIASSPLTTLELARERLRDLRTADPPLAATLSALVADRARIWSDLAVEALTLPAEARVLRRLLMFAESTAARSSPTTVTITQQELASAAGVARATVNRVLGREALSGTLRLGRGKVTLLDADAIVQRVGEPSVSMTTEEGQTVLNATPGPVTEERRTVTVLVVSVAPPTDGDDGDPGHGIIELLEARTGSTVSQLGRKVVASFAGGGAGADALGAVAAASELLKSRCSGTASGAGIATGEVVVRADGNGDSITRSEVAETALSLQAAASPGQVLLDDQTQQLTHRRTKTRPVAPNRWEVVGSPAEATNQMEHQILVGRDDELGHVLGIFARTVRDRRPRLVTLSGPAGVGKTRLADEVAARAKDMGATTLWGRSRLGTSSTGYSAFADQLRSFAGIADTDDRPAAMEKLARAITGGHGGCDPRLVDHLTLLMGLAPPSFSTDRSSLFRAARQLFEILGAATPLLVLFDDVQWAEPTMLDLIEWLALHVSDTPMLLLVLARPELADSRPGWGGGRPGSSWLELDGLPPDDATTLLSLLVPSAGSETRRQIVEMSGGNPLFLEELAATVPVGDSGPSHAPMPLPVTVTTAISARLDTLPRGVRAVLLDAAVIGASFWPGALRALGYHRPALEQALEALEERNFVRRERDSRLTGEIEYRFRHDLIQVVAYGRMPAPARRQRHAAVAGWLERAATADTGESASTIAYHWTQAGEFRRAHRKLTRAAAAASQAGAHREAATLLDEILEGPGAVTDKAERAQLLAQRGVERARVGEWSSARADLETALRALPPDAVDAHVRTRVELAMVCQWLLDLPALRQHAQDALELARSSGRRDLAAAAEGAIGWADSSEGHTEASLTRFEVAMAHSDELPTDLTGPMVELSALTLYWLSRPTAAIDRAEEALALGRRGNDSTTVIRSLGNLILAQGAAGQYEDALATYDQAKEFGNEYGTATFLARATAMCGGVHLDLFDYDGAEALAEEARERARTLGFALPQVSAAIDLMLNYARRGEPSRAHRLLRSTTTAVRAAQGAHGWLWRLRLAQAHAELNLARGEWDAALRAATEVTRRATATGRTKYQVLALCVTAEARHQIGDPQASHDAATAAETLARPTGEPALILRSLLTRNRVQPSRPRQREAALLVGRMSRAIPDRSLRGRFAAGLALQTSGNGDRAITPGR